MKETTMWAAIAMAIAIATCGSAFSSYKMQSHRAQAMAEAIKAGADPTKVMCAMDPPAVDSTRVKLCGKSTNDQM